MSSAAASCQIFFSCGFDQLHRLVSAISVANAPLERVYRKLVHMYRFGEHVFAFRFPMNMFHVRSYAIRVRSYTIRFCSSMFHVLDAWIRVVMLVARTIAGAILTADPLGSLVLRPFLTGDSRVRSSCRARHRIRAPIETMKPLAQGSQTAVH